jgi:predicted acyltransferase
MTAAVDSPSTSKSRLISLDVLRGFTILVMLLVNNIGHEHSTPHQLLHSEWGGIPTLADYVFPWFLFCLGVAIPYSAASFARKGLPGWRYDLKVIQRTAALFAIGFLLVSSHEMRPTFTIGILHLIALAYFVSAMLYELPPYRRALIVVLSLGLYWVALAYMPIPGIGFGFFQEGLNIVHHINKKLLEPVHLDGLVLALPSSCIAIIGTLVGDLIRRGDLREIAKLRWLEVCGAGMIVTGLIWSLSIPPNKPLLTPSFVLLTAGSACVVLALLHYLIDLRGWRAWAFPLIVFGSNAILAYVGPILLKNLALRPLDISVGGIIRVTVYTCAWWLILYILYRKRIFLKV